MYYRLGRPAGAAGAARAIVGAIFLGIAFLVVSAAPAGAHTALKATSPKDGGTLAVAPSRLVMEFTAPILTVGYRVIVLGPHGGQYQAGMPQFTSNKLTQPLKPLGPAGEYQVEFRVVAYDGHPLTSSMAFTLTKPGPAAGGAQAEVSTAPLAAETNSVNNAPPWAAWTAGAITLLVVSGAVLYGRRKTRDLD